MSLYFIMLMFYRTSLEEIYTYIKDKEPDIDRLYYLMLDNTNIFSLIYLFIIIIPIFTSKLFFLDKLESINTPSSEFLIKKIKEYFKYDINIHLNPKYTQTNRKGIYISFYDANDILQEEKGKLLFKLYHEYFHFKIRDHYLGEIQKIFIIAITFMLIVILSSYLEEVLKFYYFSNILSLLFAVFVTWGIIKYYSFSFFRSKECLCDFYAGYKLINTNDKVFTTDSSIDIYTHPNRKQRILCKNGNISPLISSLFSSNLIFYSLVIIHFVDNVMLIVVYISILVEIILASITFSFLRSLKILKVNKIKIVFWALFLVVVLITNYIDPTIIPNALLMSFYSGEYQPKIMNHTDTFFHIVNLSLIYILIILIMINTRK